MRSPNRAMGRAMNDHRTRWILAAAVLVAWPTVPGAADAGLPRWSRDGTRMVWVVKQSVSQVWLMEKHR